MKNVINEKYNEYKYLYSIVIRNISLKFETLYFNDTVHSTQGKIISKLKFTHQMTTEIINYSI